MINLWRRLYTIDCSLQIDYCDLDLFKQTENTYWSIERCIYELLEFSTQRYFLPWGKLFQRVKTDTHWNYLDVFELKIGKHMDMTFCGSYL